MRQCGECTLCCKLVGVASLDKPPGQRCKHQRHTGCRVYHTAMPSDCSLWNCRWLVNNAGATSRPDRVHYVIDLMPDFITAIDNETGEQRHAQVIQIWVDPRYPDAWRDPDLLAYLRLRGEEGIAALIRYNSKDAFVLLPPAMAGDEDFHELRHGQSSGRDHSFAEIAQALGGEVQLTMEDEHG
jgi:hypothetical protein